MLVEIKVALLVEVADTTDLNEESLNTREISFKLVGSETGTPVEFKCLEKTDIEVKALELDLERVKAESCPAPEVMNFLSDDEIDEMIAQITKEEFSGKVFEF